MDYKEITLKLENNDKEIVKEIINTLNEEDYITIKELFIYLKNHSKKIIVNNYLNIIVSNTKDIYDDEMHLTNNFSYLREEQPLIVKYLYINNYQFTENQIHYMHNDMLVELPIELVVSEICSRIEKKHFSISLLSLSKIKKILYYAYDNQLNRVVETMIDDYDFIIQYNNSTINTSKLLENSQGISFREKIMTSNRFTQELKTTPELITPYLSKEEIIYLRTDINIKNLFLSKGLRYDVIEDSIVKNLLDNINIFKTFPFSSINEFFLSVEDKDKLLNNREFIDIYMDKMDAIYDNVHLFKIINKSYIERLITSYHNELIFLNLIINIKDNHKEWLLTKEFIRDTLFATKRYQIYEYLDHKLLFSILKTKKSIFNFKKYFHLLKEPELQALLNNDNSYNQFIEEIKENNIDIPTMNKVLSTIDLSYQKDFVKKIHEFFPSHLYLDFFISNTPIYLEVIRSNKNLYSIINSFIPTETIKIKQLMNSLNKEDLLKIKQITINNPVLAETIKEYSAITDDSVTDIYLNTPIDDLIKMLKRKESLVIDLIAEKIPNDTKRSIILSSDEILNIFLNTKYIKNYDKPLLLSILDRLNINQKEKYFNNTLLEYLYSKETIKVYNNLKEKNQNILDTLNISFLNDDTIKLKYNILEYVTKYKDIQKYILLLLDYITVKDITSLFAALEDNDKEYLLPKLLRLICYSLKGKNRKKIGNFVKFFKEIGVITKEAWLHIISYLLYHLPLVQDTIKNNLVGVPTNYNDIVNYEIEFYKQATDPLLKHYRLTREEVYYLTNKYSKGYLFINTINHLNLKNKEKVIKKSYTILEVYKELNKIKEDYNNKLSYELKRTINNLSKTNNKIIKENYTFYISKDKYSYLILENNELNFEKYMKYISDVTTSFKTVMLKDDNTSPQNGIYFTYSNFNKNTLKDIDENGYYLNKYSPSKNGNALTLPDNILVVEDNMEDLTYIVNAIKLYKSFKTYKELKIILLNKEDIYNKLVDNYKRNMTVPNLSKCVKMLSDNNYIYPITNLVPILYKHLNTKDKKQVNRILIEHHIKEEYLDKFDEIK